MICLQSQEVVSRFCKGRAALIAYIVNGLLDMKLFTVQEFNIQGAHAIWTAWQQFLANFPVFSKTKSRILQRGDMILIINIFIKYFPAFCFSSMCRVAFPSTEFGWSQVVCFGKSVVYRNDQLKARIFSRWRG